MPRGLGDRANLFAGIPHAFQRRELFRRPVRFRALRFLDQTQLACPFLDGLERAAQRRGDVLDGHSGRAQAPELFLLGHLPMTAAAALPGKPWRREIPLASREEGGESLDRFGCRFVTGCEKIANAIAGMQDCRVVAMQGLADLHQAERRQLDRDIDADLAREGVGMGTPGR